MITLTDKDIAGEYDDLTSAPCFEVTVYRYGSVSPCFVHLQHGQFDGVDHYPGDLFVSVEPREGGMALIYCSDMACAEGFLNENQGRRVAAEELAEWDDEDEADELEVAS